MRVLLTYVAIFSQNVSKVNFLVTFSVCRARIPPTSGVSPLYLCTVESAPPPPPPEKLLLGAFGRVVGASARWCLWVDRMDWWQEEPREYCLRLWYLQEYSFFFNDPKVVWLPADAVVCVICDHDKMFLGFTNLHDCAFG